MRCDSTCTACSASRAARDGTLTMTWIAASFASDLLVSHMRADDCGAAYEYNALRGMRSWQWHESPSQP